MRNLRRQPALLADPDRLAHALDKDGRFIAHVRDVDAAQLTRDAREFDDLVRAGERPGT